MKNLYSCLKEVYSPTSAFSSPLLSADWTKLISEEQDPGEMGWAFRWCSINDKAIERLPQVPVNRSLIVTLTLEEVPIAIRQLSSGKAPRSDSIPAEIYKESGSVLTGKLLTLIQLIWMKEQLPQDFNDVPSSIFTNGKGINRHTIITMESPYFQFWARSEPESFWIASTTISNMNS